ncbi:MAG: TetR/AcrR family transcriptional regulator [Candidatus Sumerlaeia bacterium]|nr:TetR/AcrR family transcriptional regulator [Candidatus Sumerlaeia bacterium]
MNDSLSARERILEASLAVVRRDGPAGFTMDAIAREAGLSKGGLFHHFASKEALLAAFLEFYTQRAFHLVQTRLKALAPEGRARLIRTMIAVAFPEHAPSAAEFQDDIAFMRSHRDFMLGMVTAGMISPELLAPLRAMRTRIWSELLSDPETGEDQLLLWLAMHGFWMARTIGAILPDDPHCDTVAKLLISRAESLAAPAKEGTR